MPDSAQALVAFLATYAVHSTILLGLAWLVARIAAGRRLALQEAVWRCALGAALLTAGLQSVIAFEPLSGRFSMSFSEESTPARPAVLDPVSASSTTATVPVGGERMPLRSAASGELGHAEKAVWEMPSAGANWLASAWLIGATIFVFPLVRRSIELRGLLRDREAVDENVRADLDAIAVEQLSRPVRLSTSERLSVPIALGVFRPEICVPGQMLADLGPSERRALLAHELAHHVRRDPFWHGFTMILERVFFFQPLQRLGGRKLRRLAEYLADDWAVERTGSHKSLASCLTDVAAQAIDRPRFFPSPGVAGDGRELETRVVRLVEKRTQPTARIHRGFSLAIAALTVMVVAAIVPGLTTANSKGDSEVLETSVPSPTVDPELVEFALPLSTRPTETEPVPAEAPAVEPPQRPTLELGGSSPRRPADRITTRAGLQPRPTEHNGPEGSPQLVASGFSPWTPVSSTEGIQSDDRTESEPVAPASRPTPETTSTEPDEAPEEEPSSAEEPEPVASTPAVMIKRGWPSFPRPALKLRTQGAEVHLRLDVDETGEVTDAEVVSEPVGFGFEFEALKSAPEFRFEPATREGVPVPSQTVVAVTFDRDRHLRDPNWLEASPEPPPGPVPVPEADSEIEPAGSPESPAMVETPPVVVHRAVPRFPPMARRLNKWKADVTVEVEVDGQGNVANATVVGQKLGFGFEKEALRAVHKSQFVPATLDGVPVAGRLTIAIHFEHRR